MWLWYISSLIIVFRFSIIRRILFRQQTIAVIYTQLISTITVVFSSFNNAELKNLFLWTNHLFAYFSLTFNFIIGVPLINSDTEVRKWSNILKQRWDVSSRDKPKNWQCKGTLIPDSDAGFMKLKNRCVHFNVREGLNDSNRASKRAESSRRRRRIGPTFNEPKFEEFVSTRVGFRLGGSNRFASEDSIIVILGELAEASRLDQDESITRPARTTVTTAGP